MIISDLNHLETVEKKEVVGGLSFTEIFINKNVTVVNQTAVAAAKNESIGGYGGASASAYNSANIGGYWIF